MRLFFALWPDPGLQCALAEWSRLCHGVCGGRRQRAEKLHVTLAFLGEVDAARYPALLSIAHTIQAPAFELRLDQIGYWPHNRIVYAGASKTPSELTALARSLSSGLGAAGFPTEKRDYVPHITLLRDARRAPVGVNIEPLRWRVDALSLVETRRSEKNLTYRRLQCWTLAN